LQGAIMGMTRAEIPSSTRCRVLGRRDFIDTPVKRYSSGMNARSGSRWRAPHPTFCSSTKVLSVGDVDSRRSGARMRELLARGVPLVFVSTTSAPSSISARGPYSSIAARCGSTAARGGGH